MKNYWRLIALNVLSGLATSVLGQTTSATQQETQIQSAVVHKLAEKKEFKNVQPTVDDGIVTLTGSVDLYQQKLDAAKRIRKVKEVRAVKNMITVAGKDVPDADLTAQLDRKLYYDRIDQDNLFNFVFAFVEDGVATLSGETRNEFDRDSALALVDSTPGVNDVINNVKVAPASIYDERLRAETAHVIYGDPVLGQYAADPGKPIRIVVDNGHITLYGTVASAMDKQIAGMKAGQVFGTFTVTNNLEVIKKG